MGFKEALVPIAFFIISIIGIASTAITVKTYLETGKEKDANFNFSATILAVSILGLIGSGFFTFKAIKSGGAAATTTTAAASLVGNTSAAEVAGSQTNIGAQQKGLSNKLENISANAALKAKKAAEAAELANALGTKLGNLKTA